MRILIPGVLLLALGLSACGESDEQAAAAYAQRCLTGDLKGLLPSVRNRKLFCDCLGGQMRLQEKSGVSDAKKALLTSTNACKQSRNVNSCVQASHNRGTRRLSLNNNCTYPINVRVCYYRPQLGDRALTFLGSWHGNRKYRCDMFENKIGPIATILVADKGRGFIRDPNEEPRIFACRAYYSVATINRIDQCLLK